MEHLFAAASVPWFNKNDAPNKDRAPDYAESPPTPPGVQVRTGRFRSFAGSVCRIVNRLSGVAETACRRERQLMDSVRHHTSRQAANAATAVSAPTRAVAVSRLQFMILVSIPLADANGYMLTRHSPQMLASMATTPLPNAKPFP